MLGNRSDFGTKTIGNVIENTRESFSKNVPSRRFAISLTPLRVCMYFVAFGFRIHAIISSIGQCH